MAEAGAGDSSSPDTDRDFEPSAELLVGGYDDEATMEEEENLSDESGDNEELDDLQKESDMPIEAVLAMYGHSMAEPLADDKAHESAGSTSGEDILNNHDLTLDKEEVARDVLQNDDGSEASTIDELIENVDSSATSRLLNGSFADEDGSFDGEDEDYLPMFDEEVWKKSIQVGEEFQADIPDLLTDTANTSEASTNTLEERLLWNPDVLAETEVTKFLKELIKDDAEVIELPEGVTARDDEQALYTLLQSNFNVEEAVRRKKLQTTPPTDPLSLWSEDECQNFESGLRVYGKNFFAIHHNKVRTRSVGELVQFYYFWKRTERREAFCSRGRLERKRLATPGITDYADRFMDRMDSEEDEEEGSTTSLPVDCSCSTDPLTATAPTLTEETSHINALTSPSQAPSDTSVSTATFNSAPITTVVSEATPTLHSLSTDKRPYPDNSSQQLVYNNDSSLQMENSPKRLRVDSTPTATEVGN